MITLSGQRFVGVSQADETLSGTFKAFESCDQTKLSMITLSGTFKACESCDQTKLSMITLSGQRFVGVSQADETRGERSKRVNHAIKQRRAT
jgi:hypothetical protein